jgi:hypothetical protein
MAHSAAAVANWPRNTSRDIPVILMVADPLERSEKTRPPTKRLTLDLFEPDVDFMADQAAYRNALARAERRKLDPWWTRKSIIEAFISAQCDAMRVQLKEMVAELGPIPRAKDKRAMDRYVQRVLEWRKKK